MKTINNRTTDYPIDDLFLKRYSPRAFSGEKISEEELMTLFDAARWAPSSSNSQPWSFIYTTRDNLDFEKFLAFLAEGNKVWCAKAGAFVVVISKKISGEGKRYTTHSLDTGAAWENLALHATNMGIITHGMAGFDYEKARTELLIPEEYDVEMMIAIGKPGKIEDLPEYLRQRENPSGRKELKEMVFRGKFQI